MSNTVVEGYLWGGAREGENKRDRETERNRETEREKEREIEGERERERERESEGNDVGVQEDRDDILLDSTIFEARSQRLNANAQALITHKCQILVTL